MNSTMAYNYGQEMDYQIIDPNVRKLRMCILGSIRSGKSTLAWNFNKTTCPYASFPPANNTYVAHYKMNLPSGEVVDAVIADRNYVSDSHMTDQTFSMIVRDCDGIIIMADQRNPSSVDDSVEIARKCMKYKPSALRLILWNFDDVYSTEMVSKEQLGSAAANARALHFKVSAKEGFGVEDAMIMFVSAILDGGQNQIDKYGVSNSYTNAAKPIKQNPKTIKANKQKANGDMCVNPCTVM